MKFILFLAIVAGSMSVQASMPPTAESLRRFQLISTSSEVMKALGNMQWVTSMAGDGENFVVTTSKCALNLKLEEIKIPGPVIIGPPPLKVKVGQVNCLP
jgi:hypothetical protein